MLQNYTCVFNTANNNEGALIESWRYPLNDQYLYNQPVNVQWILEKNSNGSIRQKNAYKGKSLIVLQIQQYK